MKERLEAIKKAALEKIEQADAMDSLNDIRVSVLGKKGELTQVDVYKRQPSERLVRSLSFFDVLKRNFMPSKKNAKIKK